MFNCICTHINGGFKRGLKEGGFKGVALWSGTNKNVSTGPLARPFTCSLAPLTRLLAPHYSLCLRTPLRSLARSFAHFAHSRARGKVYILMSQYHIILTHSDSFVHSLIHSFARTAHSFACSVLLASLARSAGLTRSLTLLNPSLVGK